MGTILIGFCPLTSKIASIRPLFFDLRKLRAVFSENSADFSLSRIKCLRFIGRGNCNEIIFWKMWIQLTNQIWPRQMEIIHDIDKCFDILWQSWIEFSLFGYSRLQLTSGMGNQKQKCVQHSAAHRRCTECMKKQLNTVIVIWNLDDICLAVCAFSHSNFFHIHFFH